MKPHYVDEDEEKVHNIKVSQPGIQTREREQGQTVHKSEVIKQTRKKGLKLYRTKRVIFIDNQTNTYTDSKTDRQKKRMKICIMTIL